MNPSSRNVGCFLMLNTYILAGDSCECWAIVYKIFVVDVCGQFKMDLYHGQFEQQLANKTIMFYSWTNLDFNQLITWYLALMSRKQKFYSISVEKVKEGVFIEHIEIFRRKSRNYVHSSWGIILSEVCIFLTWIKCSINSSRIQGQQTEYTEIVYNCTQTNQSVLQMQEF